jgi:M3 family oligoendopeptidase
MTHECGHAFQCWSSRNQPLLEYRWPTYEACEIHSMGMEFLTYPWMELFFGDAAERFRLVHMIESVVFLPYGCAVDEFQHFVYSNPDCGPEARKKEWSALEKKYLPWVNYGDLEYASKGGFWQGQLHIYNAPFYYIDYVLAQTCALQIWKKVARESRAGATGLHGDLSSRRQPEFSAVGEDRRASKSVRAGSTERYRRRSRKAMSVSFCDLRA